MVIAAMLFSAPHFVWAGEGVAPPVQSAPAPTAPDRGQVEKDAAAMDPNAVAVFAISSFEFGTVYEGADLIHDFIVKNEGTADLKIINVKSG
jgi:hypothetical protein